MNLYDRVQYVNQPYSQTHPSRLATLARLHGMNPAPVETARVLDIGASEGGNIIPMALSFPDARFTGLDLAAVPVERGNRVIHDLGLSNVRLVQMDLLDVDQSFGEFDYIIAHGLYAWTPPAVRDKLLAVACANLSPQGVAFVSYNTYPAGHVRKMLREMMLFRIGDATDIETRLLRTREILSMVASRKAHVAGVNAAIAEAAEELLRLPDGPLLHDSLAPVYEPAYLWEFVAHAQRHGLAYLADGEVFDDRRYNLEPALLEQVNRTAGKDRVAREQYLDILRVRGFRQSLLCHQEVSIQEAWEPERALGLYIACRAQETPDGKFELANGASVSKAPPEVIEFLRELERLWPRALRIGQREAALALHLYRGGLAEVRAHPGFAVRAGSLPVASPLARYQAQCGEIRVTTLDHHSAAMEDEPARRFLLLLDGSRDCQALASAMGCSAEKVEERLQALSRHGLMLA